MGKHVSRGGAAAGENTAAEAPENKKKIKREKPEKAPKRREEKLIRPGVAVVMLAVTYVISAFWLGYDLWAQGVGPVRISAAVLVLLVFFAAFGAYLLLRQRPIITSFKRMIFICVLMLIALLLIPITMGLNHGFTPVLISILLIALMTNEKVAMLSVLPLSAMSALELRDANAGLTVNAFVVALTVIIISLTAVYALNIRRTRSTVVIASGIAGLAGVVTYALLMVAGGVSPELFWQDLLWMLGSCLLCGVLTVGLMPVFEAIFDITSEERLNELLNADNPLLKRLMTEAPGTYHHSQLVASLAEAAAEEVGADPLLVRVSSYYHDVGKLRCPACFKENQKGANMHDTLDPYESAKRIIAHQQDGVTLLEKHKFPKEVVRIVGEHHGDSVMVYFYDKAVRSAPEGQTVDVSLFRYPSHKPTTKESAILMLADCCEAAVRSMANPNMDEIKAKVVEVITHKWDKRDSMLWDSPLTFKEIKRIEESFIKTFSALYHERVEYPDLEDIDVR